MDDELKQMLDVFAIRELAQRYAVAISFHDVDAVAELFDPEVDNGPSARAARERVRSTRTSSPRVFEQERSIGKLSLADAWTEQRARQARRRARDAGD